METNTAETPIRKISLKTVAIIAIVVAIGVLIYVYKDWFIAATVNGSSISRFAVIKELEKASGKQALDSLITKKLVENEALKKGVTVTSEDIDAEIKRIEGQISAQGGTLEAALAAQGMTMDVLKDQIVFQKKVEKILEDKLNVTDAEVDQYITGNKIEIPKGQEEQYKAQIREQLRGQKINQEVGIFIESLRSQAKIRYFVNY